MGMPRLPWPCCKSFKYSIFAFVADGALGALLGGLAEKGPEPQRTNFQAMGITEEAPPDKPGWLPAPSVVIGPASGESFRASSIRFFGASIGERLFEEGDFIQKKFKKTIRTVTKNN